MTCSNCLDLVNYEKDTSLCLGLKIILEGLTFNVALRGFVLTRPEHDRKLLLIDLVNEL